MKTTLRVLALVLSALIGLWALGRGIGLAAAIRLPAGEHPDIVRQVLEASISIAGGICVLSVAVQQIYCWRTHRKNGGLL